MKKEKKSHKKDFKISKKIFIIIIIVAIIVGIIWAIIRTSNNTVAGKVVDGKVEFVDKIETASKNSTSVIEIKSINPEKLDTVIITSEKLEKIKNNDTEYTMNLKDYMKKSDVSNRDLYNIQKAIELKIVKEDDNLITFFYKVTGFKNEKQLIKFCENAMELLNK